jgi:two-component system, OmpR family, KDP operon response regulator KdpE
MNARAKGTILLVEDHADSLSALAMLLRREGYQIHVASGVREASEVAASSGCDLLLADLGLPDGNGMELMRELKVSQGARGIAISGFTDEPTKRNAAEAGFERFIEKPAVFDSLLSAVRDVMAKPSARFAPDGTAAAAASVSHAH